MSVGTVRPASMKFMRPFKLIRDKFVDDVIVLQEEVKSGNRK